MSKNNYSTYFQVSIVTPEIIESIKEQFGCSLSEAIELLNLEIKVLGNDEVYYRILFTKNLMKFHKYLVQIYDVQRLDIKELIKYQEEIEINNSPHTVLEILDKVLEDSDDIADLYNETKYMIKLNERLKE